MIGMTLLSLSNPYFKTLADAAVTGTDVGRRGKDVEARSARLANDVQVEFEYRVVAPTSRHRVDEIRRARRAV